MPWLNISPALGKRQPHGNGKKAINKKLAHGLIFYETHNGNLGLLEWREKKERHTKE